MADLSMDGVGTVEAGLAGDAVEHPAGVVLGSTGYITTGAGFTPEEDPGNPTPGMRLMTSEEREGWGGKVAPAAAEEPEVRRCRQVKENGYRCGHIPAVGETLCHQHRRFGRTRPGEEIDVPLMEDPASIRLVISQTVRAMGRGDIPPANGRAMIAGARVALDMLQYELAKARLLEKTAERGERAAAARAESKRGAVAEPAAGPVAFEEGAPVVETAPADEVDAVTDEERVQEMLAAADALEVIGEPEDAELAEGQAAGRPRRAGVLFTEEDLQKQWDRGLGRPFRRPLKRLYAWEKKLPEPGVGWPRPGR